MPASPQPTPAPRPTSTACRSQRRGANRLQVDWNGYVPPRPSFLGTRVVEGDLAELARYIDWTPFFQTWELKGRFPAILDDERQGEAARALFGDAEAMLAKIVAEKWFAPKAVVGFWPANAVGDDIRLFSDEMRREELATFFTLRQQLSKSGTRASLALADTVAPLGTGLADYVGGFVVTAGAEEEAIAARFAGLNDDYQSIMVKALADRLAEAFAEALHARVRQELWGYAPEETYSPEELIGEPYRGIRPAPGYPSQPDHTEKATLFRLLDAERQVGVKLTESYAMWPGSSVSGSTSHTRRLTTSASPRSSAIRSRTMRASKGMTVAEVERWLGPILNYVPGGQVMAEAAE